MIHLDDPDAELMLRAGKGDRKAFESLVLKYQRSVLNTAYRYTGNPSVAEELAQDVFVRVYRGAATYKPEARFSTWLFTIVRNICFNYRSREGKHDTQFASEPDRELPETQVKNPEEELVQSERDKKIRAAIRALPDSLRLPLILYQFEHLSYEEVAAVLKTTLAAVKVRIHRARTALIEPLKELV